MFKFANEGILYYDLGTNLACIHGLNIKPRQPRPTNQTDLYKFS